MSWAQVKSFANKLYQDRRFLVPKRQQQDLTISISVKKGIRVGDLYNHLYIGPEHKLLLNGDEITTSQEKRTTQQLLERFLTNVDYGVDRLSAIQLSTKHNNMLKHLTVPQIASMRATHWQWSHIGEKQIKAHRQLQQKKWPPALLRTLPSIQEKQILENQMDDRMTESMVDQFLKGQSRQRVLRKAQQILSLFPDRRFVWGFEEGSNEVEEQYYKFVCLVRCQRLEEDDTTTVPCLLCMMYWKSKRRNHPLAENVFQLHLYENNRSILFQHANPISPFHFNKVLTNIVRQEPLRLGQYQILF